MKIDLILIDYLNTFFRFKWTLRNLTDLKGNETGVYYGLLNFVRELRKKHKNAEIIFCQDRKPTYKLSIDDSYKANRKVKEENKDKDFFKTILRAQKLLSLYNAKQAYADGYEADDVASFFVEKYRDKKEILLVSGDNDWFEMAKYKNIYIFKNGKTHTRKQIRSLVGYPLKKMPIVKSITGEKKENVLGIPRFPRKLIKKILKHTKKLDDIFDESLYCDELDSKSERKWMRKIFENEEQIRINFELKSLCSDIGEKIKFKKRLNDREKLYKILLKMNMRSLVARMRGDED